MKTFLFAALISVAAAAPAAAQQGVSWRAFGLITSQNFAAQDTFDAVFSTSRGTFLGGGVEAVHTSGLFLDIELSHFSKAGQRAFVSDGQTFPLGIPLKAAITPYDVMLGYRVRAGESRFTPYIAAGLTSVGYKETSDFADTGDDVDDRKNGFIGVAGIESRVTGWLSVSVDLADSKVTGILGQGGISKQLGEDDLGGFAARFRVIVGR